MIDVFTDEIEVLIKQGIANLNLLNLSNYSTY